LLTVILLLAAAATPVAVDEITEPDLTHMTAKEINAFNAKVPRTHRFHIRCVSTVETGSLVKSSYVCRTNEQWRKAEERGNDNVRETMDRLTSKAGNSN
jgi:hypothetical protein